METYARLHGRNWEDINLSFLVTHYPHYNVYSLLPFHSVPCKSKLLHSLVKDGSVSFQIFLNKIVFLLFGAGVRVVYISTSSFPSFGLLGLDLGCSLPVVPFGAVGGGACSGAACRRCGHAFLVALRPAGSRSSTSSLSSTASSWWQTQP
jgi:hypothetical protein